MYQSIFEQVYTARGEEKGRHEGIIEVARNLLDKGLAVEEVIKYTDLSKEQGKNLSG
jgi:predicted transposase/invertase (TIGR01784 family)